MNYYIVVDGRRKGPLALDELVAHGLERDSPVWHAGLRDWTRADEVPAIQDVVATVPPPLPAFLGAPEDGPHDAELTETPATFQRLYRWWLLLFILTFSLPLVGALCLVMAQTEYGPVRYGSG